MSINFKEMKKTSVKINTSVFRTLIDRVMGKFLVNHQYERILKEILDSGYVKNELEITSELILKYVNFKNVFPRTQFLKSDLDDVDNILSKIQPDCGEYYSAQLIFDAVNSIEKVQDSNFYYWFDKVRCKFSTTSIYSKETFGMILFQAIRRQKRNSEKGTIQSWLTK